MTVKMRIRPVAGRFLWEEFVYCAIFVALGAVTLSVYFAPASTFARGQGKTQKGFATAQEPAKALVATHKKVKINALTEILGPKGHRLVSSGAAA